jgi:FAD dependent oxidoreductase
MTAATPTAPRPYDIICFGDEVPGILAVVAAAREYRRQTGKALKTLVMAKGSSQQGVGGHLVRGGLAYLDRSNIPPDVRQLNGLGTFGDPAGLYKEFLQRSGVKEIALDRLKADAALRKMLSEVGADIISQVQIKSVTQTNTGKLTGIELANGSAFSAKQFIDCTVNAELAQAAGVPKVSGFGGLGLPDSELPVTLVFETEGLTIEELQKAELSYLNRFSRPNAEAQNFIQVAAGNDPKLVDYFKRDMVNAQGKLRTMHVGSDHIDIPSKALSIAYHSFRGKKFSLSETGLLLDSGNVAILPNGRLSWNALLIKVTAAESEALARNAAKPNAMMLEEIKFIGQWFRSIGATAVKPMNELYIRHAGNVTAVMEPLSGSRMLEGGVSASEAIATFGYPLDVRGGIAGLGSKAAARNAGSINFEHPPLFNVGIRHALVRPVPNLAVISPGSGFDGYACAAGRIVEFNVAVGQGVGIAATLAIIRNRNLADMTNMDVRQVLVQTTQLPRIYGKSYLVEASRLQTFESTMMA